MKTTRTTCAYCGVGCGVLATKHDDGSITIEGDPDHPANYGRLCSKGLALGETLGHEQRMLHPHIHGAKASWHDATSLIASKFAEAILDHGQDSVAFYVSGQLLTEDYYVANKLMKGFIGSANIDTNSRLCMSSAVAGQRRAFGADVVPCSYADLEKADLVVLVGSNLAWCHPVLFQRIQAEREKRDLKLVVIDPRRTITAESADMHLAIYPGSDVALFNGLLSSLYKRGEIDSRFVFARTSGLAGALLASTPCTVENVAAATRLSTRQIQDFYDLFAATDKTVTSFSMGVNQSTSGTNKVNSIINCHLLTGRIGLEGTGPFSITGQPNAMGGREVGGMANMLAAHMEIENSDHRSAVQSFWKSPAIAAKPGLKAVDLFKAVGAGKIKALWIMATNPAVSLPDAEGVAAALKACPFVVVSDVTANTETARYAHVLLPAKGWGEKNGMVTNSERRMSRQRDFLETAGEARADWQIISDVATAMGFAGFDYARPSDIFREFAALTQVQNNGTRRFDLAALAGISDQDYDVLEPYQWGGERPFADKKFETADGRAQFVATHVKPIAADATEERRFILNTGRIRDQWHTMTRTGLAARLFSHRAEPHIEISPSDAGALGLNHASLATVSGENGLSIARVLITDAVKQGQIFQPMHWSGTYASGAIANSSTISNVDPISGQPELKAAPVSVKRFAATWYGFGVAFDRFDLKTRYWSWQPQNSGVSFECADDEAAPVWRTAVAKFAGLDAERDEISAFHGAAPGQFRCAIFRHGKLRFAFFASDGPVLVSRNWLAKQLGLAHANPLEILAGRPLQAGLDEGPIVCACMGIGRNTVSRFMATCPAASLNVICNETKAGTGCGSCRPEIVRMINETSRHLQAAE
jgi:assimilatory nitrate reductase catalytic subunit